MKTPIRLRTALWLLFLLFLVGLALFLWVLPHPSDLRLKNPPRTAMMTLRIEEAAREKRPYRIRQSWVPLKSISPLLKEAVLMSEDSKFYEHDGFDFEAIEKAARENLRLMRLKYGASTISQQLVKNLYLSPSKNPLRKLSEAWLTFDMERTLSKPRILELYLNIAEWAPGVFGAEAAARFHFHESAFTLTPAHAVLLAAMLPLPLHVNPNHPPAWIKRRAQRLLQSLYSHHRISQSDYQEATQQLLH